MAGIAGGTLLVPLLNLFNVETKRAVGTGAAMGIPIAVAGTLSYIIVTWGHFDQYPYMLGAVNLLAWILIIPLTILFAPLGAKLAHQLNPTLLKRSFGLLLLLTGAKMILG